jgi:regulator of sigma D
MSEDKNNLFGYNIKSRVKKSENLQSPVPPTSDTYTPILPYGGIGLTSSVGISDAASRNEFDLIMRCRALSIDPLVDQSVDDVVNEAISSDLPILPVKINLSTLETNDNIKKIIRDEFKHICNMLDFENKGHDYFRLWYVDGRICFHKIIDTKNPQKGIQELRHIDSLKIKPVRQKKDKTNTFIALENYSSENIVEFYQYNANGFIPQANNFNNYINQKQLVQFSKDSIVYIPSGAVDASKGIIVSYLAKAIKAINQLRLLEDAQVIYALTRSTEKLMFYVDVGNIPTDKAQEYMNKVMTRYKNKLSYDTVTGQVADNRHLITMTENYFLPRRDSGKGTEITTLPAGQNLGANQDNIEYFKKKSYQALNVPSSRQEDAGGTFNIGRGSEISRDEIKFTKFVGRLRKKFSMLFLNILRTQLLLKNIITEDDWESIKHSIQIDYIYDNHYAEIAENEMFTDKLNLLALVEPYIGKYFSVQYIREKILKQTDAEIEEIDLQIMSEVSLGILPDPNQQIEQSQNIPKEPTKNA